jgi:hypothetical protein
MFRIEMLPARQGDCLWIEYGPPAAPHRVLIDGGPEGSFDLLRQRIEALPPAARRFELVVATHVDRDHVAGLIPLLQARGLGLEIDDVWFNGWPQLAPGMRGPLQGEILGAVIEDQGWPWNRAFGGGAVLTGTDGEAPPVVTLPGGLRLTLLAPTRAALDRFAPHWAETVRRHGLEPGVPATALEQLAERPELRPPPALRSGVREQVLAWAQEPFSQDTSLANGSSIAFLAEFEGRSCLFGADAHPSDLVRALRRVAAAAGTETVPLQAFKLAHHGGAHNLSAELAALAPAARYLVSTNGSFYGHPDPPSLARALQAAGPGAALCFNYASEANAFWSGPEVQAACAFRAHYPPADRTGLAVEL